MHDPYQILQVDRFACREVIDAAWKALTKKYHPDTGRGDEPRMKAINAAHDLLSDERSRAAYDSAYGLSARLVLTFGKHRGLSLNEVPFSYIQWIAREKPNTASAQIIRECERLAREAA